VAERPRGLAVKWLHVAPAFRIHGTDDLDEIRDLAAQLFQPRELESDELMEQTTWWVAVDSDGDAVGFCGARMFNSSEGSCAYLCLVGVLPHARGNRLQLRLTRTALRWARREGALALVTYTHPLNAASMASLIRAGMRPYVPETPWCGDGWVYWRAPIGQPVVEPTGPVH
jgi:GNAT superfamily N-acetyltransferase